MELEQRLQVLEDALEEWRSTAHAVVSKYGAVVVAPRKMRCNGAHIAHELCGLVAKYTKPEETEA